ncbi:hypothetical protein GS501_01760 [Saccharibacter sp. 17.LH.SD]|uniref:hypothetical protein n=1 Tax=Saccharibacter sp. 17.LH.SD TaxID=2689393 RepID=UPI00136928E5|nr:hypothetical protein [Saccharibacter sp. 17.LH.SD]MXV43779.1 hypothetical protein [Saccharibacter sp. 17.LH.SD]
MSSPVEVGQEVLSAQGQIIAHCVKRHGIRVAFAVIALVFLLFAAISFHGVLWALFFAFCHFGIFYSALCVLGVDLLFVVLFIILAAISRRPGLAEERARIARDNKLHELKQSIALSALLNVVTGPMGRSAGGFFFKKARSAFSRKK